MKRHINFGSIGQFRETIKDIQHSSQYVGLDENQAPIYNRAATMPVVYAVATEKVHGCVSEDTLVLLSNGIHKKISKIIIGDEVVTFNETLFINENKKVKNVFNQPLNKEWLELIFDNTTLICTKDHKIYTKNRGYVEAQFLDINDEFVYK